MKQTLCVLLFLCTSLLFAEVLFYDDFNRANGAVGNSWTNIGPASPVIENGCMKVISNSLQGVRRDFTSLGITSGIYYVSYDWKITSNNWLADAFPNGTITYLRHDYEGNLYYDNTSDFSNPITIGSLATDTWANFKLKVNIDTDRFSIWVNNNLVADNIAGLSVTDFTRFTFRAGSGSSVTQYIDNFIVYNENPPATPTNLTAIGAVNNISLNWTGTPQDFLTYKIYRSTTSPAATFLAEVPGTQTSYIDNTAAANTDYYYRVKATSFSLFDSDFSNEIMEHLQPQVVISPTEITFNVGYGFTDSTQVSISNVGNNSLYYQVIGESSATYGDGFDGDYEVAPGATEILTVAMSAVVGNNPSSQNTLQVATTQEFSINDEILIITMRDSYDANLVGVHEFNRIYRIEGNTLILYNRLNSTFNQSESRKHQVLRVPNFSTVLIQGTITGVPWNGETGGVLCFRSSENITVSASGTINMTGKGYRAYGPNPSSSVGYQGEGVTGTGFASQYANANAGGGGVSFYSCGGGGGHGSAGGNASGWAGTNPGGYGGYSIGVSNSSLSLMGGAGGSGGRYNAGNITGGGGSGGSGGGIIFITGRDTNIAGQITSNGNPGERHYGNTQHGSGGGGAGGSVFVISDAITNNGSIYASGGGGSTSSYGIAGGGGLGRIFLSTPTNGNGVVYPVADPIPQTRHSIRHIKCIPDQGLIPSGESVLLSIVADTRFLQSGSYTDTLFIQTNDPNNTEFDLITNTNVISPIPSFIVPDEGIIFNTLQSTCPVTIVNDGEGQMIFSVLSDICDIQPNVGNIAPGCYLDAMLSLNDTSISDGIHTLSVNLDAISVSDPYTFTFDICVDFTSPQPVAGLSVDAVATNANQIGITWSANAVADSVVAYIIYRRGRDETNWHLLSTVPASQLWYVDSQFTGLDSTYVFYRVRAEDWVGNLSAEGESLQAGLVRFLSPNNLLLSNVNNRDILLSWDPVTETISGLQGTPSCYVIYKSQYPSPITDFDFLTISFTNEFTHQWALHFQPLNRLFYVVTAYGGDMGRMQSLVAQKREWKYGELEQVLQESGFQQLDMIK